LNPKKDEKPIKKEGVKCSSLKKIKTKKANYKKFAEAEEPQTEKDKGKGGNKMWKYHDLKTDSIGNNKNETGGM